MCDIIISRYTHWAHFYYNTAIILGSVCVILLSHNDRYLISLWKKLKIEI